MDYATFTSAPVILAASSALMLGVVGSSSWRWMVDWRQSRILGMSIREFRHGEQRRRWVLARVRTRGRRESSPGVQVDHALAPDAYRGQTLAPEQDRPGTVSGSGASPDAVVSAQNGHRNRALIESRSMSPETAIVDNVRLLMLPRNQMTEFMAFEIAHAVGASLKLSATDWVSAYRRWAAIHAVGTMPESIFLNLLGNAPGIRKTRERRKDPGTGRVIKNAAGTPTRDYFYALDDAEDAVSKKPKVKRETKAERCAREAVEMAERRRIANVTPQQTWAEYLASIPTAEREELDLQRRPRKVA